MNFATRVSRLDTSSPDFVSKMKALNATSGEINMDFNELTEERMKFSHTGKVIFTPKRP